jgi:outer membrane PBP1 activator LpoA protein
MLPPPVPSGPPPSDVETRPAPGAALPPPTSVAAGAPEPEAAALPEASTPAPVSDTIALVLPLQSALYGRAAEAVRAGFLAAANAAGRGARVQVIGHGDDGVLPAFAAASEAGVALIVGPLTRDDLKTVLALAPARTRMLALNQPDDGSALPPETYALAVSVESDAALLARQARDDGARTLATLTSDTPLQRRFRVAFAAAWERSGGATARDYRFDPNPEVLALMRRELAARPSDAVLMCVASGDAALAKSFLAPGLVYASSQIADGLSPEMLRDLEGVRYVEIPWLADPADPAFARLRRASMGDPVLDRLYALGLDAFALAELLANPDPPSRIEFDGAIGHLSLTRARTFAREGRIMVIRGGAPAPLAPRP